MNIKILLLLFYLCDSKSVQSASDDADSFVHSNCTTPENKDGFCIRISNCAALILRENIASTSTAWECDLPNTNRTNPKVCCDADTRDKSKQLNTTSTTTGFISTTVPSTVASTTTSRPNINEACGIQSISSRILGGVEALPGEYPWIARLLRKNSLEKITFSCTGVLVRLKVILTSAHCIRSPNLDQLGNLYAVALGERETECPFNNRRCLQHRKIVQISQGIIHPQYRVTASNHDNDIGIIILKEEVEISDYISTICLLEYQYNAERYHISGWGKTETETTSTIKLKTSVEPYPWDKCAKKYRTINVSLTENQICAGGAKNRDSCQGDSGGPLMTQIDGIWYVAGLVSFGVDCGREGWPGIYVNLPKYIEWIKDTITQKI